MLSPLFRGCHCKTFDLSICEASEGCSRSGLEPEIEKNLLLSAVNDLTINARLQALENIIWGYLNIEFEEWEPGYSKTQRALFLSFYIELLQNSKSSLRESLDRFPDVETLLQGSIDQAQKEIVDLKVS